MTQVSVLLNLRISGCELKTTIIYHLFCCLRQFFIAISAFQRFLSPNAGFLSLVRVTHFFNGPNGSLLISILLQNSEFQITNSEICTANFGIRNCEVYVVWANGNRLSTLAGILNSQTKTRGSTT